MPIVATSPWSWHSHLAHAVFNQLFQSKQTASLVGWLTYKSPISGKSPIFSWDPPGSELIKRPRFLLVESAPAWDRGETPWFPPDDPTQWVSRIQLPLQGWPTEWIDGEQTLMVVGTEETLNQRPCCLLLVNRPSRHPLTMTVIVNFWSHCWYCWGYTQCHKPLLGMFHYWLYDLNPSIDGHNLT